MEEHFLRECKLQSSRWFSICQNYLQQIVVIFDNICLPLLCLLMMYLSSHLARVMNPAVLPAALLVAAQLSPHTTSLLSSSCRPTDRLCRAAWSLGLTMSGTLSPPQSLTELGKYQTFPPAPAHHQPAMQIIFREKAAKRHNSQHRVGFYHFTLRHHCNHNQVYRLFTGAGGVY